MKYASKLLFVLPLMLAIVLGSIINLGYADSDPLPGQDDGDQPVETATPAPTLTPSTTPPPPIPAGALTGTVIRATTLLVREAPYFSAPVIERVRRGETYQVIGRDPDARWFLIQLYGRQGWVWGYYLFVDGNAFNANTTNPFQNFGDPANTTNFVVQSTAGLRLRAEPNIAADQIGRVAWGDTLPVIGRSDGGDWYQVVYQGTVGWVVTAYTDPVEGNLDNVPIVEVVPGQPPPPPNVVVVTAPPQIIVVTATPFQ